MRPLAAADPARRPSRKKPAAIPPRSASLPGHRNRAKRQTIHAPSEPRHWACVVAVATAWSLPQAHGCTTPPWLLRFPQHALQLPADWPPLATLARPSAAVWLWARSAMQAFQTHADRLWLEARARRAPAPGSRRPTPTALASERQGAATPARHVCSR